MITEREESWMLTPSEMLREVAGVAHMVEETFLRFFDPGPYPRRFKSPAVFFCLPGLLGPGDLYWGACKRIESDLEGRVRLHVPQVGTRFFNINCRPYSEALELLEREAEALHPKGMIGHSWGGILAKGYRALHGEMSACAIGSPIHGTPSGIVRKAVERFLGFNPHDLPDFLHDLRSRILESPEGIMTISSPEDPVAPPACCEIKNAENVFSRGGHAEIVCQDKTFDHVKTFIERALRGHLQSVAPTTHRLRAVQ